ncbi:hypothetical protein [Roseateles asaccharophilus]|uniref:Uncharacterized protein n=1 Tax=Roseateles asaccharophilus TaxID=582607 RepID=A0ABU2AAU3_9BURK|nr:hypothetical protein [Roseateles asaccharophilus]MDR7334319.1 hypothetical protein [Roseateles asaccharophilus]
MNEYTKDRLREELIAAAERLFADQLRRWKEAGLDVQKTVDLTPKKDGRHSGSVTFLVPSSGTVKSDTLTFDYVPRALGVDAHWQVWSRPGD